MSRASFWRSSSFSSLGRINKTHNFTDLDWTLEVLSHPGRFPFTIWRLFYFENLPDSLCHLCLTSCQLDLLCWTLSRVSQNKLWQHFMYFSFSCLCTSKYCDFPRISSEHVDVHLDPLQGFDLVHEAVVPCGGGGWSISNEDLLWCGLVSGVPFSLSEPETGWL